MAKYVYTLLLYSLLVRTWETFHEAALSDSVVMHKIFRTASKTHKWCKRLPATPRAKREDWHQGQERISTALFELHTIRLHYLVSQRWLMCINDWRARSMIYNGPPRFDCTEITYHKVNIKTEPETVLLRATIRSEWCSLIKKVLMSDNINS